MITILAFIPQDYIKSDKYNSKNKTKTISLFSSIKTSILPQTFTNWELFLVTNVQNLEFESSIKETIDKRIKIIYTPDLYFNLNSLYNIDEKLYHYKCTHISIFDLEHDIWNANKLQSQYDVMSIENSDVIGCECTPSNECIDSNDARVIKMHSSSLFHSCPFLVSTILIKKKLFKHFCPDIASLEIDKCSHDKNFTLVTSSFNTMMAQFHSLLLFISLREYKLCYIGYSKQQNRNENRNENKNELINTNYKYRTINQSLVETSNHKKLSNLYDNTTCDHIFFKASEERLREKYIRIKIFSDFCSSETCKQKYESNCKVHEMNNYGADKYLYITTGNTYTHAILLNCPIVSDISVPPECVLGLAFEPIKYLRLSYDFIDFAEKHVGMYYIGYKHPNLTSAFFKEHHGFMWHTDYPLKSTIKNSKNAVSIIISNKYQAPGHIYRSKLVAFILKHDLAVDIWGNGTERYGSKFPDKKNIKGPFKDKEPYESYSLSICVENYRHPHYFSEKISNCLVCNTTPIYLGCTEIETYFPNQVVHLSGNLQEDCALLVEISKNPKKYVREIKTNENDTVLNLMKNLPWNS